MLGHPHTAEPPDTEAHCKGRLAARLTALLSPESPSTKHADGLVMAGKSMGIGSSGSYPINIHKSL